MGSTLDAEYQIEFRHTSEWSIRHFDLPIE
jgi:hypothetical protein